LFSLYLTPFLFEQSTEKDALKSNYQTLGVLMTQVTISIVNARLYQSMKVEFDKKDKLCRELQEANQLKQQMLMMTSHELRTPLSGILGLTEMLIENTAENVQETLHTIYNSSKRMCQLIDDLLDLSKLSRARLNVRDDEEVNVEKLVTQVTNLMRPLAEARGLEMKAKLEPDLPLVLGDSNRLQQVLVNLIGNAIKFTTSGHVEVSACLEEKDAATTTSSNSKRDVVVVTVKDTGMGIDKVDQERIFGMFQQVDAKEYKSFAGTGIGLTIAKDLVELHAGRIWVESEIGDGSRFRFTLPRTLRRPLSSSASTSTSSATAAPTTTTNKTEEPVSAPVPVTRSPSLTNFSPATFGIHYSPSIPVRLATEIESRKQETVASTNQEAQREKWVLVVDDEHTNRLILKTILKTLPVAVREAKDGKEALEYCLISSPSNEHELPSLVLLDLMMPGMNGWNVCWLLREKYSVQQLPIVMISACSAEESEKAALYGANAYL